MSSALAGVFCVAAAWPARPVSGNSQVARLRSSEPCDEQELAATSNCHVITFWSLWCLICGESRRQRRRFDFKIRYQFCAAPTRVALKASQIRVGRNVAKRGRRDGVGNAEQRRRWSTTRWKKFTVTRHSTGTGTYINIPALF